MGGRRSGRARRIPCSLSCARSKVTGGQGQIPKHGRIGPKLGGWDVVPEGQEEFDVR